MNPMLKMMLQQLQLKNPQMYGQVNQMMNSGTNPMDFAKQLFGGMNNNQMGNILNQAKSMGCPDDVLQQFQNMNNR